MKCRICQENEASHYYCSDCIENELRAYKNAKDYKITALFSFINFLLKENRGLFHSLINNMHNAKKCMNKVNLLNVSEEDKESINSLLKEIYGG